MLLTNVKEQDGWITSHWSLTYPCSWEQILSGLKAVYDYYDRLEILVDDKKINIGSKDEIDEIEESSRLTFRGISKIVNAPLMITMVNQLQDVYVETIQQKEGEFSVADYEDFNKSLCQYLDSIELLMHL